MVRGHFIKCWCVFSIETIIMLYQPYLPRDGAKRHYCYCFKSNKGIRFKSKKVKVTKAFTFKSKKGITLPLLFRRNCTWKFSTQHRWGERQGVRPVERQGRFHVLMPGKVGQIRHMDRYSRQKADVGGQSSANLPTCKKTISCST